MANVLKMAKVHSIQTLHARGWSQRRIARDAEEGKLDPEVLDEKAFAGFLYAPDLPDPGPPCVPFCYSTC